MNYVVPMYADPAHTRSMSESALDVVARKHGRGSARPTSGTFARSLSATAAAEAAMSSLRVAAK